MLGILGAAALVVLAYHPIVFSGKTFDPAALVAGVNGGNPPTATPVQHVTDEFRPDRGATPFQTGPWAQVTNHEIEAGIWPLWTPFQGAGEPLAGNAQSATFDPLMLAINLHPTELTWDVSLLLAFMLGSAATYLFLRALGAHPLGSLAAAGVFTLSGFFAMDTSDSWVHLYAYLPILMLAVELTVRSGRLRWVGLLGGAVAGAILAGMPEASFFVLVTVAAYGAYRLGRQPPDRRWAAGARLIGAAALGLCLAAPLILSFAQFVHLSYSVHAGGPHGVGTMTRPKATLLYWLVPFANGYPAAPRIPQLASDRGWIGVAAVVCLVAAIAAPAAFRKFGGSFFLATAAVVMFKNHGILFFGYLGRQPVLNQADSADFAAPIAEFCFAALAGIGVHALVTGGVRRRWFAAGMAGFLLVVAVLVVANRPVLAGAGGSLRAHAFALAACAGSLAVVAVVAGTSRRAPPRVGLVSAGVALAVMLAELYLLFPQHIYAARVNPYHPPPWMAELQRASAAPTAARVMGFQGLLFPDIAGVFGVQDARTLNAVYVARYRDFVRAFISAQFTDRWTGDYMGPSDIAGNPMFNLLGVRYILYPGGPDATLPGVPVGQFTLAQSADGVNVWRNNQALPRAFVVPQVHAVSAETQALSYLRSFGHPDAEGVTRLGTFDAEATAVVEAPARTAVESLASGLPSAPRSARIVSYAADRVVIRVPPGPPGLLVLTDVYYPGWAASANGHAVSVLPTDVAFRGVVLGPGATTVVFQYHFPGGILGWGLPLLGVLVLVGVGVEARRKRRGGARGYPGRPSARPAGP
jgi:hypothetical protein